METKMMATIVMLLCIVSVSLLAVDAQAGALSADQECSLMLQRPTKMTIKVRATDGSAVTSPGGEMRCSSEEVRISKVKASEVIVEIYDGARESETTLLGYEILHIERNLLSGNKELKIDLKQLIERGVQVRNDALKRQEILAKYRQLNIPVPQRPSTKVAQKPQPDADGIEFKGDSLTPQKQETEAPKPPTPAPPEEVSAEVQKTGVLSRTITFRLPESIVQKLKAEFIATAPENEAKIMKSNGKALVMGNVTIEFHKDTVVIREEENDGGDKVRGDLCSEKKDVEQTEKFLKTLRNFVEAAGLTDTETVLKGDGYWSIAKRLSDDPGEFTSAEYHTQLEMLNGPMWVEEGGKRKALLHPDTEVKFLKKPATSEAATDGMAALNAEKRKLQEDLNETSKQLKETEQNLKQLQEKLNDTQKKLSKASTECLPQPSSQDGNDQPRQVNAPQDPETPRAVVSHTSTVEATPTSEKLTDRIPIIDPLNDWIAQNDFLRRGPLMLACLLFLGVILFMLKRRFLSGDDSVSLAQIREKNSNLESDKKNLGQKLESSEKERKRLEGKLGHANRENCELVEKVEELKGENNTLDENLQASEKSRIELITKRDNLASENGSLREENQKLEGEIKTLKEERTALQQEVRKLNAVQVEDLEKKIPEYFNADRDEDVTNPGFYRIVAQDLIDKDSEDSERLQKENADLSDDLRAANLKITELEKQLAAEKTRTEAAEKCAEQGEKDAADAAKKATAAEEVAAIQRGRADAQEKRAEAAEKRGEEALEETKRNIEELTGRVEAAEKAAKELKSQLQQSTTAYEELTSALARNVKLEVLATPQTAKQDDQQTTTSAAASVEGKEQGEEEEALALPAFLREVNALAKNTDGAAQQSSNTVATTSGDNGSLPPPVDFWKNRLDAFNRSGQADESTAMAVPSTDSPVRVETVQLTKGSLPIKFFKANHGSDEENFLCPHCDEQIPFRGLSGLKRHVDPEDGNCPIIAKARHRRACELQI